MKRSNLKAPFSWVGGKSKLANDIAKEFVAHNQYVEVFGGALNVLYTKEPSKVEIVNDINSELINLHKAIRNNPQSLSMYLNNLLVSREIFDDIKTGKLTPKNNIERASFYYYLLTQSFGSKCGNFAMTKSLKAKNIYKDYNKWSNRLKHCTIENLSYDKLIKEYDRLDTLFYLDPPYYQTENYYTNCTFTKQDHINLRDILSNIKGKFVLSYNDEPFIKELYKDYNIINTKEIDYILGKNVHKKSKKVSEIIIKNY